MPLTSTEMGKPNQDRDGECQDGAVVVCRCEGTKSLSSGRSTLVRHRAEDRSVVHAPPRERRSPQHPQPAGDGPAPKRWCQARRRWPPRCHLNIAPTSRRESEPALDPPSGRNRSCTGNRRWSDRRVMFATLDAGRVCNEAATSGPDPDSCAAHEETAVEWMRETFAEAELQGSAAIIFIFLDGFSDSHTELWLSLREELTRFRKPVVDICPQLVPSSGR